MKSCFSVVFHTHLHHASAVEEYVDKKTVGFDDICEIQRKIGRDREFALGLPLSIYL